MKNLLIMNETKKTAAEIMNKPVVTVRINATVDEAIHRMQEKHVNCLVVEDAGLAAGLISREDILYKVVIKKVNPRKRKVHNLMTDLDMHFSPNSDVRIIRSFMLRADEDRTVVTAEGRIVGLISIGDIFRHISAEMALRRGIEKTI